jgi:hypothetical protein
MLNIFEIDENLSRLCQDITKIADTLIFQEVCELSDELTVAQQNYAGIYKIDIHVSENHPTFESWASWFKDEWMQPAYKQKFVPNPKKKRLAAHTDLSEWVPLYLGKSKKIAQRVWEHMNLKLDQPTTAMKLKHRSNMAGQRFRLSTIRVDVKNYNIIMPYLENIFREKYNPILGRQ